MKNLTKKKKVFNNFIFTYNTEDGDEMNEMYDNDMVNNYNFN